MRALHFEALFGPLPQKYAPQSAMEVRADGLRLHKPIRLPALPNPAISKLRSTKPPRSVNLSVIKKPHVSLKDILTLTGEPISFAGLNPLGDRTCYFCALL